MRVINPPRYKKVKEELPPLDVPLSVIQKISPSPVNAKAVKDHDDVIRWQIEKRAYLTMINQHDTWVPRS